jgi:hypothetical protein
MQRDAKRESGSIVIRLVGQRQARIGPPSAGRDPRIKGIEEMDHLMSLYVVRICPEFQYPLKISLSNVL